MATTDTVTYAGMLLLLNITCYCYLDAIRCVAAHYILSALLCSRVHMHMSTDTTTANQHRCTRRTTANSTDKAVETLRNSHYRHTKGACYSVWYTLSTAISRVLLHMFDQYAID